MMFPKPHVRKKKYTMKQADSLFSLLIRSRKHCQAIGLTTHSCKGILQCAHIVTRGNKRLRFSEENALCLCSGHHLYFTLHPDEWYWDFIPKHFPKQFAYVQRHRNETVRNNANRMKDVACALECQLLALGIEH